MQTIHKPIARSSTTNRSAVTNGSKLLVGIDMRSPTARRYRDLVQAYLDATQSHPHHRDAILRDTAMRIYRLAP